MLQWTPEQFRRRWTHGSHVHQRGTAVRDLNPLEIESLHFAVPFVPGIRIIRGGRGDGGGLCAHHRPAFVVVAVLPVIVVAVVVSGIIIIIIIIHGINPE